MNIWGNIWQPADIEDQPEVTLRYWKVIEVEGKDPEYFGRHFVGWNVEDQEGRVSSKIVAFDAKTMRGVTDSGRVYQLEGKPGSHPDAEYVLRAWLRGQGVAKHAVVELERARG